MTTSTIPFELELPEDKLVEAFRRLPPYQRVELLKKLQAAEGLQLVKVSASTLEPLTGVVSLGGDAVTDTEALYDDNGSN
jgi:hypothetical protein